MRRSIAGLLALALAFGSGAAQAQTPPGVVSRSFGPGWLQAVRLLPDGSAVFGGRTPRRSGDTIQAWLFRLDRGGNVVWEYRSPRDDRDAMIDDVFHAPAGGMLALGSGRGPLIFEQDRLQTFDIDGTRHAVRLVGDGVAGWLRMTVPLSTGGFASLADDNLRTGVPNLHILAYDAEGKEIARKKLEATSETPLLLRPGPGGRAVAVRERKVTRDGKAVAELSVMVFSAALDLLHETPVEIAGAGTLALTSLAVAENGDVFTAGYIDDAPKPGESLAWVTRLAPDGRVVWARRIEGLQNAFPMAVAAGPNGSIVVGGCAGLTIDGVLDPWIVRLDADGNRDGELTRPFKNGGTVLGLDVAPDGTIAATGIRGNGCGMLAGNIDGTETFAEIVPPGSLSPSPR